MSKITPQGPDNPLQAALFRRLRRVPERDLAALAERSGLSVRHLTRIRAGQGCDVRLSTLYRLAMALGVKPETLIGGSARHRRRPAPIGRGRGAPRGIRRDPLSGRPEPFHADPDDDSEEDEEI